MAAAATLAVHDIVKEAVDVGVGLNSLYKAFKNQSWQSAGGVQQQDARDLRGDMKAFECAVQKVLNNQASLLALVSKGSFTICSAGLDALQLQINAGFDAVMQSVQDKTAIGAARLLKTKSDTAMLACNRMVEGIVAAAEQQQRQLPLAAWRDIEHAERSAAELYMWANTFVPSSPESAARQSKLQTMPYVVAMAFAARVQAITHMLDRDAMEQECDRVVCLKRARRVVDDFIAALARALEGVMADTSLLEVAMVYQLPMALYLTFITSFRASMDEQLQAPRVIVVWDDGLAPIRDVLHWKPSDAGGRQGRTIELDGRAEEMWWLAFADLAPEYMDDQGTRARIHIRDLCRALGVGVGDGRIAHIAFTPGRKSALLQLPPASALRAAVCANIAHAHRAVHPGPSSPPPSSFAYTTAPLPPPLATPRIAAAPRTLIGHFSSVLGLAVCPDAQRVLSCSCDCTARVWSLRTGQHLRSFSEHSLPVLCVALSPDGEMAVSGGVDKSVRVWSVDEGGGGSQQPTRILQGHSDFVQAVAVSPHGRSIASGSWDTTVRLWNAESGQCQATLTGHSHIVWSVAFSPCGKTLVSGSHDKSIRVWDVRSRTLECILHGHCKPVCGVAVTPDGQWLVSGSRDRTVKVWSMTSGEEEMSLGGHGDAVTCVAAFPDGQRIASGSEDKSVRVWNLRSKALEVTLRGGLSDCVECVAVSPDGRSVLAGSRDMTIKAWALSSGGGMER